MASEARQFLETLFVGKPDDLYLLIWTRADKQSHWFQKVDDAIRFVESLSPQDVYVGTGLSARDHGPFNRCPSDEIAGSIAVFVDIDLRSDAHANTALPTTVEEALSILPPEFPPTFVILTGNGIHAWFRFPEPWIFENDEERQSAAALSKQWNTLIRDNASMKGWKIERLGDLARLLRIPGTTNCKDPANPKNVTVHTRTDCRYNPSELLEFLDDLGIPDAAAEERAAKQWAEQFGENPLKIDLAAAIPQEQLDRWIASDPRFQKTWFRQRPDLLDQSQSGYDMALANFGVRVGLPAQQIVDLIIFHRQIFKQPPRTKLEYFQRTLSKAAQHARAADQSGPAAEPAPFAETINAETGSDAPNPLSGQPKSDRQKIELCKQLSSAFGVELLRLVKVAGEEPFYRMDLAQGSISFPSVGKFISWAAVKTAIAGRVGILIPYFKPAQWSRLAQMMLDACIDEDGGEELESQAAARLQIGQYLGETMFIPCIAGQPQQDLRKPMVLHDQISVCASDLQLYLNKPKSQNLSVQAVVRMLSAAGAKMERVRPKKKEFKEQSRWFLPVEHFDPADYPSSMCGGSIAHG